MRPLPPAVLALDVIALELIWDDGTSCVCLMRMAAIATANRLQLVEHWRSVPAVVCELVLSSCLAACTMLFAGRSGPPTRHQDQRPALHTKVTTAGVCDETASAGLHVGVIDANVEACLVSRDLFGSEEPESDPRLIRERVARRF